MSLSHSLRAIIADAGWGLHLLVRLSPVPTMLISYAMGAMKARFVPYMIAAVLAGIPQVAWVYSGAGASRALQDRSTLADWLNLSCSLVVAIAVTVVVSSEAKRRLDASADLVMEIT